MRLATSFVRATAGAVLLVDCGGGSPKEPTTPVVSAPVLTTVTVALSATTVQIGQSDTARADGFDQRGDPLSVVGAAVWRTSSSAIATVSASGVITGVALGEATITATVGGKEGEATVVVVPVAVQTVLVSPPGWIAAPGETLQLTATTQDVEDNVLTGRIVTWSSTDAAVATVSATGLVAARLPGTAIIVATSEGQSGAAVIDVAGELPGGVVVSIATPATDAVVGDTLNVVASASSSARISGAVASVGSQTLPLTRVLVGASGVIEAWVGRMILNGSYGTFELLVSATDAHDALGVDSVSFTRQKKVLGGNSTTPGRKALRPSAPKIP
jgi:hypothetical protein